MLTAQTIELRNMRNSKFLLHIYVNMIGFIWFDFDIYQSNFEDWKKKL